VNNEVNIQDLKHFLYLPKDLDKQASSVVLQADLKETRGSVKIAECEGYTVWMNIIRDSVYAKCTCLRYEKDKPCVHILALWKELRQADKSSFNQQTAKDKPINQTKAVKAAKEKFKPEKELILLADAIDEKLILNEWDGDAEPLIYHYKIWDKKAKQYKTKITLSMSGWTLAMHKQGSIEVLDVVFEELKKGTIAKAKVRDLMAKNTVIGVAERYNSEEFKYTVLASKAIRNALKKLINPIIVQNVIRYAKQSDKTVVDLTMADLRESTTP